MTQYQLLQNTAKDNNMFAYKDPDCRNRFVIVDDKWNLDDLADEVARAGGMRWSPFFIGGLQEAQAWLEGYEFGRKR